MQSALEPRQPVTARVVITAPSRIRSLLSPASHKYLLDAPRMRGAGSHGERGGTSPLPGFRAVEGRPEEAPEPGRVEMWTGFLQGAPGDGLDGVKRK